MKEKLFNALKQEYANLGLGDEIIQGQTDSLAATGLITDENLEAIVKGQKQFFSSLQSGIDKRVTSATEKVKKELEEKTKVNGAAPNTTEPKSDNDLDAKIDAIVNQAVQKAITPYAEKVQYFEAKEQQTSRQNTIEKIAQELGIPEWRVKEGFALSSDADEAAIRTTLSTIKQNIVTAGLEQGNSFGVLSDNKPTEDEIKEISNLI